MPTFFGDASPMMEYLLSVSEKSLSPTSRSENVTSLAFCDTLDSIEESVLILPFLSRTLESLKNSCCSVVSCLPVESRSDHFTVLLSALPFPEYRSRWGSPERTVPRSFSESSRPFPVRLPLLRSGPRLPLS